MLRENLNDLVAFMVVAREGSFTKAASQLGVSQSALSHALRGLEERLEIRLLARSTRSVSPTEAGEKLLATLAPRFEEIEAALTSLGDLRGNPMGTVRISCSKHSVTYLIWPKISKILHQYPDLQIEISADNRFTDIVADRFDIGVRLGESLPKDMIGVTISPPMRLAAVASPEYFAKYGKPTEPQELKQHNCINMRLPTYGGFYAWEFEKEGQEQVVRTSGQLAFNDSVHILQAAIEGFGLCYIPEDMAADALANGQLERVLEDWSPAFEGYSLYYPNRRNHSTAFSIVVEALRYRG
ncbi:LysR family transcriptional regulator [Shewanella sp.]|uniref:LysR family transcriptional regulator n=1 Tax=Shewanella sp. TaxID=50422 RepID=UPI003A974E3A